MTGPLYWHVESSSGAGAWAGVESQGAWSLGYSVLAAGVEPLPEVRALADRPQHWGLGLGGQLWLLSPRERHEIQCQHVPRDDRVEQLPRLRDRGAAVGRPWGWPVNVLIEAQGCRVQSGSSAAL